MSLFQVKEVLPQLNSRSCLGRVIVNPASGLEGDLAVRPSEDVVICCGTAYLSIDRLEAHQKEGNCGKYSANAGEDMSMPVSTPRDNDPLGECVNELEIESVPVINSFGSVRAEDIDDVDIFEEEPRNLIYSEASSRQMRPSTSRRLSHDEELFPNPLHELEINAEDDSWQDVDELEDDEDDDQIEYNTPNDEWDELEDVEVYGGSDMRFQIESKSGIRSSLGMDATEMQDPSSSLRQSAFKRDENVAKYKCEFPGCLFSTVREKNLMIHSQNAHDPSSNHACGRCVCRYKTKSELTRHMKMFHGQYGQIAAAAVPEVLRITINGKNLFKCEACGYMNRSQHTVLVHVHSAHDPNGNFPCSYCVCRYSKGNQLTQHVQMHHKDKFPTQNEPSFAPFLHTSASPQPSSSKSATSTTHLRNDASTTELITLKTESGAVVEFKRVITNNLTKFECKLCPYSTPKRTAIIAHARGAHVSQTKYSCPFCSCQYNSAAPLQAHMNRVHPHSKSKSLPVTPIKAKKSATPQSPSFSESPGSTGLPVPQASPDMYKLIMINQKVLFKCEACGYMSRDFDKTNIHIDKSHGPSSRYTCRYCTFRYSHHNAFATHLTRVHPEAIERVEQTDEPRMELLIVDGVKIYRCKLCLYAISIEAKCLSHVLNSHRPDGKFACDMCPCRFLLPGLLSGHKSLFHRDMESVSIPNNIAVDTEPEQQQPILPNLIDELKTYPRASASPPKSPSKTSSKERSTNRGFVRFTAKLIDGKRWFYCNACEHTTTKENAIKSHVVAAHNPVNRFKCPKCSCRYAFKGRLTAHIANKHKIDTTMPVLSPKVPIPEDDSNSPSEEPTFQCDKCSFSSTDKSFMEAHKNLHLPSNKYPCTLCSCRFPSNSMLLQHLVMDHDSADSSPKKSNSSSAPVPDSLTSSVINFEGYDKIVRDGHTSYKCTEAGCMFFADVSSHIKHHVGSAHDPSRTLCCGHCSWRFASEGRMNKHLKDCHGIVVDQVLAPAAAGNTNSSDLKDKSEIPFAGTAVLKCHISGCGFETEPQHESILENHMQSAHSPEAKFKCEQCPCRYNNKAALKQHVNSTHGQVKGTESNAVDAQREGSETPADLTNSPGKPFQCKFCDFSTKNRSGFITHLTASHSAKNPHQCSQCCCRFASAGGLTSHEYKAHNKSIRKKQTKLSVKTHTGLFERMTTASANITANIPGLPKPTPKPKKPCTLCSSTFNNTSSLNWHMFRAHQIAISTPSTPEENALSDSGIETPDTSAANLSPGKSRNVNIAVKPARKYAEIEGPDDLLSDSDEEKELQTDPPEEQHVEAASPTKRGLKTSKHQCSKCSYVSDINNLLQHEERAHVENGHQCSYCVCSYKSLGSLRKHISFSHKKKEHHESPSRNNANKHLHNTRGSNVSQENPTADSDNEDENDKSTADPSLEEVPSSSKDCSRSPKNADSNPYKCLSCGFSCRLETTFKIHEKHDHVKGGYLCKYCNCSYRTTEGLNSHLKIRHQKHISVGLAATSAVKIENESLMEADDNPQSPEDSDSQQLRCTLKKCSFTATTFPKLVEHMKAVHNLGMDKGEPPNEDAPFEEDFSCLHCSFTTKLRMKLKQHEKKHEQNQVEEDAQMDQEIPQDVESGSEEQVENSRKRKRSEETVVEPKAKKRKALRTTKPANVDYSPVRTRRSAEVARKVISSVIQSEQLSDEEVEYDNVVGGVVVNDGATEEPKKRKARVETVTSTSKDLTKQSELVVPNPISETPEAEKIPKKVQKSATRDSSKEVATLQRATDRATLHARNSTDFSKRAEGIREFKRFTCSRCAITFETSMKLTNHYQRCEEKLGEFQCRLCDNKYVSLLKLKEHIWKIHMLEQDKQKSETPATKSPMGNPYTCSLCKLGFKEQKSYILHMSVPHLFRCKKCVFVCGTKTSMDVHKNAEHRKLMPFQDPGNDDILVVYDSSAPAALQNKLQALGSKLPQPSSPAGVLPETKKEQRSSESQNGTDATFKHKDENIDDGEETETMDSDGSEPEVGESLICVECGYFSETLEEAHEHSQAAMNIASLICSICGHLATSGCDSVLHIKSHDEDLDATEIISVEQNDTREFDMKDETGGYNIELEYQEGIPLQDSGMITVEVPLMLENNHSMDGNQVTLFELQIKDLQSK